MSLAATTSTTLTLIDSSSLKPNATTYDSQSTPILVKPKAHAWSSDNSTLYIASSDAIHAFSPVSSIFSKVYQSPPGSLLQPVLVSRDKSTLVFAQGSAIHLLTVASRTPKISTSLTGHPTAVISLSLSSDASLLASASVSGTLHVHNLAHNSHTVMKGLTSTSAKNIVCAFHPHARTRLLVGSLKTLFVYDTTRPSGPVKTVSLAEIAVGENSTRRDMGQLVAISCSPYSKTLVAIAYSSGLVGLVDLEKDKPMFKTIDAKVPITSMTFTADGSSIVMGAENGKVLVQDLRSVDKGYRTFSVGLEGQAECVLGLSVQKRIKNSSSASSLTTAQSTGRLPASLSAPLSQYDLNNATKSPVRRVVSSSPSTKGRTAPVTPVRGRTKKEDPPKRAFSPPRASLPGDDMANISVQIETLMGGASKPMGKVQQKPRLSATSPSSGNVKTRVAPSLAVPVRPSSRLSVDSRAGSRKTSLAASDVSAGETASSTESQGTRNRTASSDAPAGLSQTKSAVSSVIHSTTVALSAPNAGQTRRVSGSSTIRTARTPTPDLPSVDEESPLWKNKAQNLNAATHITGALTTPDMDRWIEAGKGKQQAASKGAGEKRVVWADSDGDESPEEIRKDSEDEEPTISRPKQGGIPAYTGPTPPAPISMEMSPIRRPHLPSGTMQISPIRSSPLRGNAGGSGSGAQELLRAVVKDVMYDYRQETREDIKGLHLDLLRMGRSWKTELRTMMDEYVGDLRELREENAKLRKENDRLRRGF